MILDKMLLNHIENCEEEESIESPTLTWMTGSQQSYEVRINSAAEILFPSPSRLA